MLFNLITEHEIIALLGTHKYATKNVVHIICILFVFVNCSLLSIDYTKPIINYIKTRKDLVDSESTFSKSPTITLIFIYSIIFKFSLGLLTISIEWFLLNNAAKQNHFFKSKLRSSKTENQNSQEASLIGNFGLPLKGIFRTLLIIYDGVFL